MSFVTETDLLRAAGDGVHDVAFVNGTVAHAIVFQNQSGFVMQQHGLNRVGFVPGLPLIAAEIVSITKRE